MPNNDYTISVGLNASKAMAGINALEKKLGSLASINQKLSKVKGKSNSALKTNAERKAEKELSDIVQGRRKAEQMLSKEASRNIKEKAKEIAKESAAKEKADKSAAKEKAKEIAKESAIKEAATKAEEKSRIKSEKNAAREKAKILANQERDQKESIRRVAQEKRLKGSLEVGRGSLLDTMKDKRRSQQGILDNLNPKSKGYANNKAIIEGNIKAIDEQERALTRATLRGKDDLRSFGRSFKDLNHHIKDTTMGVRKGNKGFSNMAGVMRLVKGNLITGAIALVTAALWKMTAALWENHKAWENLQIQFQASFGSQAEGAKQLDFVKKTARTLGLDLMALADGYAKIGSAARTAGLSQKDTEEIFLGAAEASTAFGLSIDDTSGVMRAFSQVIGKGKAQREEIVGQIGDRFPAAVGIFAKSMDKSVPEFLKLMEGAAIGTKEFVNFSSELRKAARESGALAAGLKRSEKAQVNFNQSMKEAGLAFMGGAMGDAVKEFFVTFDDFFQKTKSFWMFLGDVIGIMASGALKLLKVFIIPLQSALETFGAAYKKIKDLSSTSLSPVTDDDLKKMTLFERFVRIISMGLFDIGNIASLAYEDVASLFTIKPNGMMFKFIDLYLTRMANGRDAALATGSHEIPNSVEENLVKSNNASKSAKASMEEQKGKAGNRINGDLVVNLPPGTTPDQTPSYITKIVDETFGNLFSGQMADA